MTDNLVSIDRFREIKKQEEDQDDLMWKEHVCELLDDMKARIMSGETSSLVMVELKDEVGKWATHMLGLGELDYFTVAGILETTKLQCLDAVYDE